MMVLLRGGDGCPYGRLGHLVLGINFTLRIISAFLLRTWTLEAAFAKRAGSWRLPCLRSTAPRSHFCI